MEKLVSDSKAFIQPSLGWEGACLCIFVRACVFPS